MIVIPLIQQNNYEELRFCLRAIDLYHPIEKVMIVSPVLPDWIKNVLHLQHNDKPQIEFRTLNIFEKILAAFQYTDTMLFFNDDHHILAQVDYIHHKGLMTVTGRPVNGTYTNLLRNTIQLFPGTMDYDTHCPIVYEKETFKALNIFNWEKPYAIGIKTAYANIAQLKGEFYPDLKFKTTIGDISNRLYFSTGDNCNLAPLHKIYPHKSKFEK